MTSSENKAIKPEKYSVMPHLKTYTYTDAYFTKVDQPYFVFEEEAALIVLSTTPITNKNLWIKLNQVHIPIPTGNTYITEANKGDHLITCKESEAGDCIVLILCKRFIATFGLEHLLCTDLARHTNRMVRTTSRSTLLIKQITTLSNSHTSALDQLLINSRLFELLHGQSRETISADNHTQSVHFDKIQLAKRVINEDLSKVITIPELAKIVGTNAQYLKKYFKVYHGQTIARYTMEVKMDHARKLLSEGKLRITDISRMIGYKHSTHFTTTFKKHFGLKPTLLK